MKKEKLIIETLAGQKKYLRKLIANEKMPTDIKCVASYCVDRTFGYARALGRNLPARRYEVLLGFLRDEMGVVDNV